MWGVSLRSQRQKVACPDAAFVRVTRDKCAGWIRVLTTGTMRSIWMSWAPSCATPARWEPTHIASCSRSYASVSSHFVSRVLFHSRLPPRVDAPGCSPWRTRILRILLRAGASGWLPRSYDQASFALCVKLKHLMHTFVIKMHSYY